MKKTFIIVKLAIILTVLSIFQGCNENPPASITNGLPQDVLKSCIIDSGSFNSWFAGGKAAENGTVLPTDSVLFNQYH